MAQISLQNRLLFKFNLYLCCVMQVADCRTDIQVKIVLFDRAILYSRKSDFVPLCKVGFLSFVSLLNVPG